jgi:hypothetical protein
MLTRSCRDRRRIEARRKKAGRERGVTGASSILSHPITDTDRDAYMYFVFTYMSIII